MIQTILIMFQQSQKSNQFHGNYDCIKQIKSSNAVDRINGRVKHTQERNQLLLTQEMCMKVLLSKNKIKNNVIDELKFNNCALEKQIDDLKNQVQPLKKTNET